jgi:hypothetical protein
MPKKTTRKVKTKNNLKTLSIPKKPRSIIIAITVTLLAAFGTWRVFFANAQPNNCQIQDNVKICDVDQAATGEDAVLSVSEEAAALGNAGWIYYGAAFRAPMGPLYGAKPVFRVARSDISYHDFLFDAQVRDKEAKYAPNVRNEGVFFYAWDTGIPGSHPVYRITQGGSTTKAMFSTDKAWIDQRLAEGANDPHGWKDGGIAFYAYRPDYTVAGQVNPYDCSIQANFVTDRCKAQRENLAGAINRGDVPANNECPQTLDAYMRVPFPGKLAADCQRYWNTYMQDCSIPENLRSDRCRGPREEIARQQQEQIAKRQAAGKGGKGNRTQAQGFTPDVAKIASLPPNKTCSSPDLTPAEKDRCAKAFLIIAQTIQSTYSNSNKRPHSVAGNVRKMPYRLPYEIKKKLGSKSKYESIADIKAKLIAAAKLKEAAELKAKYERMAEAKSKAERKAKAEAAQAYKKYLIAINLKR